LDEDQKNEDAGIFQIKVTLREDFTRLLNFCQTMLGAQILKDQFQKAAMRLGGKN